MHTNISANRQGKMMGEIENSSKPTGIGQDLYDAGSHLLSAVWKVNEAQVKAVVGTGQFIAEHPTEAVVTVTTGPGGLVAMKAGQELYAENEKDLAPILDTVASAGQAFFSEASTLAMDSSKRLQNNISEKPLTMATELLICPVLPLFHSVISAAARPEA